MIYRVRYRLALRLLSKMRKTAPSIRKCDCLVCTYSGNLEQHVASSDQ